MPNQKPNRVIIDTNIWISFLIGKELSRLQHFIADERIKIIICDQLISEIKLVTNREKIKRYFPATRVEEFLSLLEIISEKIPIEKIEAVSPDPKDDFLFALSKEGKANYLVTGDIDLLALKRFGKTKIISAKEFSQILK